MKAVYCHRSLFVFVTALLFCTTLVAEEAQTITMRLEGATTGGRKHGYGNCQTAKLQPTPPGDALTLPRLKSKRPIFYVATLGNAGDTAFDLVLDESEGTSSGYDTLYVDLDNNNRIDGSTERFSIRILSPSQDDPIRLRFLITVGEATFPYFLDFEAVRFVSEPPPNKIAVFLRDSSYYVGEAIFAGAKHKFAIVDLDSNGLYNDYEQDLFEGDRVMVDLDDDGSFATRDEPELNESFSFSKFNKIAGNWYSFEPSADGTQVTLKPAVPPTGTVKASPLVASVTLRSRHQTLDLMLRNGSSKAVAGTFAMRDLKLRPAGEADGERLLWAFMREDGPEVTIPRGGEAALPVGDPVVAQLEIKAKPGDHHLQIQCKIAGKGGEVYRWLDSGRSNPGFVVTDAEGRCLASGSVGSEFRPWDRVGSWSIPPHFDGQYTFSPVIDLSGFDFSTLSKTIYVDQGRLIKVVD